MDFLRTISAADTPTTSLRSKLDCLHFRELEPIDRDELPAEQYEYSQNPCSQGFLGSPDFITPQDAQFAIDYDMQEKENKGPRSPVVLSPQRGKRPRRDVIGGMPQGSQDELLSSQQSVPPMSQDDATGPPQRTLRSMQKPPRAPGSVAVARTSGRSRMALLRSQVASPPRIRNPFLTVTSADGDVDARSSESADASAGPAGTSAAGVGRYRGDFKELSVLGQGSFCKVFRARGRLDGALYAVKRTKNKLITPGEKRTALTEVQALAAAGPHPNIVGYHSAWFEDDYLYIQLEYCEGGSLGTGVGGASAPAPAMAEGAVLAMIRDVAAALAHVHARGLAHLDVKPENILVVSRGGGGGGG